MPKCPKCGENIDTLIAWIPKEDRCEVSLDPEDNTLNYMFDEDIAGKGTTEYECPLCSEVIFRSETDVEKFLKGTMNEEVTIRYKDVNGYPNRLSKVAKSEEEAREWFEREHPRCEIIEVKWRKEYD